MKNSFIPVNNNIDKTIAFAPSLDQKFIKSNNIKQTPIYIPTIGVIENLQNQGWKINGVCEQRSKNRKISNHYVKLEHPDFTIQHKGKTEGLANLYVTNSCNGKSPLNLDLGVYRLVCSNGLIRKDSYMERSFKHNEKSLQRIPLALQDINNHAQRILTEFNKAASNSELKTLLIAFFNSLRPATSKIGFTNNVQVNKWVQRNIVA